jgi:hypothetical protein
MHIKLIPPGQGYEHLTEAVTTEFGALMDLVRQAVREKVRLKVGAASTYVSEYIDIRGMFSDRAVVQVGGRLWSYPYSMGADNVVTVAEPTEVVLSFSSVRESVTAAAAAAGLDATFREAADGSIEVTLICAGLSVNGNFYPDSALREAAMAGTFEGVRVFVKSDDEHTKGGGKNVNNLVGGIFGVRFTEGVDPKVPDTGRLVGTFKPINPADAVVTKMTEAVKRGLQGLMGLSIDAIAKTKKVKRGTKTERHVERFLKAASVDLIVEPGAGGGLDRLTEAAADPSDNNTPSNTGEHMLKHRLYFALSALAAASAAAMDINTATEDQVVAGLREACAASKLEYGTVLSAALAGAEADVKPAVTRLVEATQQQRVTEAAGDAAPVTRAELAMHAARGYASMAIAASTLPQVAKDRLQAQFRSLERFTEAAVDTAITGEREYLARFTESGRPTGGMPRIETGDRVTQIADMLDAFFDPKHKNHRSVSSIKECYIEITGDRFVTGRADRARLTESIGTDTFADALGSAITRRMQAEYRDAVAWDAWQRVCVRAPVNDFRVQERTQIGGFGDLPTVAERGPYTAFADPSDDKATYSVVKRGGLAQVTMEAFKNDDVGVIRRVPVNLGRAAKRTLYAFTFNFFASNPVVHDGLALYVAGHSNLFTTALGTAQLSAHRLAMKKQVGRDNGSKRMGIGPSMILVPDDLEEAAVDMFRRNTNNDKNFVQSLSIDVVPVSTWTDLNDWCTLADPMDIPVLEIGFLDGQEEPVLLTQDSPTEGSVFTNDVISYKVRHVYGGNILVDGWKGTTKAVVP